MDSPQSIEVIRIFNAHSLHTREQARILFEQIDISIRKTDVVFINFIDISFISRSFADELVQLKLRSRQKDQIEFCCTMPDVKAMLEAVERTKQGKTYNSNITVQRFSNTESLLQYFSE